MQSQRTTLRLFPPIGTVTQSCRTAPRRGVSPHAAHSKTNGGKTVKNIKSDDGEKRNGTQSDWGHGGQGRVGPRGRGEGDGPRTAAAPQQYRAHLFVFYTWDLPDSNNACETRPYNQPSRPELTGAGVQQGIVVELHV